MAQVLHAKALFECQGDEESELSFLEGDVLVNVKETSEEGWLHGRLKRTGEEGLFPDNYVELVYIEATTPPATAAPPTLPARSPSTPVKSDSPVAKQTSKVDTPKTLAPKTVQATTPTLPTRPSQASTPTATSPSVSIGSAKAGLRSVEKTNGGGALEAPAAVALPGLGPRPMVGAASRDDTATQSTRGPPSLPRRSNTIHEGDNTASEKASGPALSVRERMANLSMANQRLTTPGSSSSTLQSPLQLPARQPIGAPITPKPNPAARSPLSSASRPALPPRTLTESPVDNGMTRSGFSASSKKASPSSFQVQDAAVPVPKLTTFSRPRSARTSKSGGNSGGSSPSLTEVGAASKSPLTTPLATTPGNRSDPMESSTPPKLPTRTTPASNSSAPSTGPGAHPVDSGPVRFSPVAIRSNNAVVANSALPTISRNAQPLQLPSRPSAGSPNTAGTASPSSGLARSATMGHHNTLQNDNDSNSIKGSTSPFGVKLNSVNGGGRGRPMTSYSAPATTVIASSALNDAIEKAPPLPARANTIASSATTTTSTTNEQLYLPTIPRSLRDDRERSMNTVGANHPSSPSWANGHGSPLKGSAVGTRVAMMPPAQIPDMTPSEDVGIKKNVRMRYETLFKASTTGEFMDGAKVHAIYVKSRLDSKTLAQIWDLVDVDNAGRLSRAQFCMGLYLIDERLASGLIPLEVSDELWVSVML